MSVKIIRILTGDEIIGKVESSVNEFGHEVYLVHSPAFIMIQEAANGQASVGMLPAAPMAEVDELPIMVTSVSVVYTPAKQIMNHYNTKFGSGIIMPDANAVAAANKQILT